MILHRSLKHVFRKTHCSKSRDLATHSLEVTAQLMNPRESGVDFAIRNHCLKLLDKLPERINERLATMRMKGNNSNVTFISAYALTMAYSDKTKE